MEPYVAYCLKLYSNTTVGLIFKHLRWFDKSLELYFYVTVLFFITASFLQKRINLYFDYNIIVRLISGNNCLCPAVHQPAVLFRCPKAIVAFSSSIRLPCNCPVASEYLRSLPALVGTGRSPPSPRRHVVTESCPRVTDRITHPRLRVIPSDLSLGSMAF